MSARIAHEQALFSSGDRTVSTVIDAAARMNGDLDRALRETGVDPAFHTSRDRSYEEFLPWSIVDSGLSFEFLKKENKKAQAALSSLPCPAVENVLPRRLPDDVAGGRSAGLSTDSTRQIRELLLSVVLKQVTCWGRLVIKLICIIVDPKGKIETAGIDDCAITTPLSALSQQKRRPVSCSQMPLFPPKQFTISIGFIRLTPQAP